MNQTNPSDFGRQQPFPRLGRTRYVVITGGQMKKGQVFDGASDLPAARKRRDVNSPPRELILLLDTGVMTYHSIGLHSTTERTSPIKNCVDFVAFSTSLCIVLHRTNGNDQCALLSCIDSESLTASVSTEIDHVPDDAFITAVEIQRSVIIVAVVTKERVLIFKFECAPTQQSNSALFLLLATVTAPSGIPILSAAFIQTRAATMLALGNEEGTVHFFDTANMTLGCSILFACLDCDTQVGPVTTIVASKLSNVDLFVGGRHGIVARLTFHHATNSVTVHRVETPAEIDDLDSVRNFVFVRGCVHCLRESSGLRLLSPDPLHATIDDASKDNDISAVAASPSQQSVMWCDPDRVLLDEWGL
jgi:hypothetical protein